MRRHWRLRAATSHAMGWTEQFCAPVDSDLLCEICSGVLESARSGCCEGHLFCEACIQQWLRRNASCPTCRQPVDASALTTHRMVDKMVGALELHCTNYDGARAEKKQRSADNENTDPQTGAAAAVVTARDGCVWTGSPIELSSHRETCEFEVLACAHGGCATRVRRREMDAHVAECPRRMVDCEVCAATMVAADLTQHARTCPQALVACPSSCGALTPRCASQAHVRDVCPMTQVPCPFAKHGCTARPCRKDLQAHVTEAAAEHMAIASMKIESLEAAVEELRASQRKISAAQDELARKQRVSAEQICAVVKPELAKLRQSVVHTSELGSALEQHGVVQRDDVDEILTEHEVVRRDDVDQIFEDHDVMTKGHFREQRHVHTASMSWEIDDFAAKRQAGTCLYSNTVNLGGYKIGLKVYPAGEKKKDNLSIYIKHHGGESWTPINIGGSEVRLVNQKKPGEGDMVIISLGTGHAINTSCCGLVSADIMCATKLKKYGFLCNDEIKVCATISAKSYQASNLNLSTLQCRCGSDGDGQLLIPRHRASG